MGLNQFDCTCLWSKEYETLTETSRIKKAELECGEARTPVCGGISNTLRITFKPPNLLNDKILLFPSLPQMPAILK